MKRLTIRADEVRVGDSLIRLSVPDARVTEVTIYPGPDGMDSVEIWVGANLDYQDMPSLTLSEDEKVTVWR